MSTPPSALLVAEDLRIDEGGFPACDGLALETAGERVLVLGAPRALLLASCGLLPVARGRLEVRGRSPLRAVQENVVASALLDPPLPPKWTVMDYATWSARLAGHGAAHAKKLAAQALERLQLGSSASNKLERLAPHARRAMVVAAAMATGAEVLVLEDPTGGLPEDVALTWGRMLVEAMTEKPWIVFAPRLPLTSPLTLGADEALVLGGEAGQTRLEAKGAPADLAPRAHRFVARMQGPLDVLAERLAATGIGLEIQGAQVIVDLGEGHSTAELLGLCGEAQVTVVELYPLSRALS
ncbi:ABC transporter related protein [Labilithrix luteola]|uniref:ABC transporter related protein n=1 Tax=Labilithrix luteola TaxID=1391654 RepID=A0A0K1PSU2_9BACT|nr:hypothetical protein [Labilithrix luteola]AKU96603.1 ABC transporter related protein [Labilithrix luteola]